MAALGRALGGAPDADLLWGAYSSLEKLIAVMKFRLDYETPGIAVKLPSAKDPSGLLEHARKSLSAAVDELDGDNPSDSIDNLRKARNDLRALLREDRLSRDRSRRRTTRAPSR